MAESYNEILKNPRYQAIAAGSAVGAGAGKYIGIGLLAKKEGVKNLYNLPF